ncbi:uncharacterized protein LOC119578496 [Penaeus monodon]|uniref:uncharacterized protein LOC119578496 n=1 Tax=Penaeus monodon TaxID=6687 RepID=UPI0018A759FC|nr:uncharacterized protein LOC119578496 [Penaeus monodon]
MCELRGVGLRGTEGLFETSQVYEPLVLTEVSRGKTTFSSQTYASKFHSSKAVDDDDNTFFSNANNIPQPFWMIDLEGQHKIHTVEILPMYHATGRFNDIGIFVGTNLPEDDIYTAWVMLGHYQGPYKQEEGRIRFTCRSLISGRYVAVQRVSITSQKLELADVKVYVMGP